MSQIMLNSYRYISCNLFYTSLYVLRYYCAFALLCIIYGRVAYW